MGKPANSNPMRANLYRRMISGAAKCVGVFLFALISCEGCEETEPPSETVSPIDAPLIALTPAEYNATIRDLLGMPEKGSDWPKAPEIASRLSSSAGEQAGLFGTEPIPLAPWPWSFPKEEGVDDFEGMADGQEPSAYKLEELQKAAVHFAPFVLVSSIFFTCDSWDTLPAEEQTSCGLNSLERFAPRAWRRPLTDAEHSRLVDFLNLNLAKGTPEEAIVLTAAGILQAPAFVFRVEQGKDEKTDEERVPLTDWEMASRLSYFLWDTMPDPALFEAASKGELSTVEGIRNQTQRMLQDERSRDAVVRFHHQWLGTDQVKAISPARRVYGPLYGLTPEPPLDTTGDGDWPAILGPVKHSMEAEFQLFIEHVIFEGDATLQALLSDNSGYFSPLTEPIYGDNTMVFPEDPILWTYGNVTNSLGYEDELLLYRAEFSSNERAGLLTLPGVLAIGAHAVHPAPILRGKRVLERVACMEFGVPPPDAEAAAPPDIEEAESTNRERTENATSPTTCAGCHDMLNPPGFAFENYDAMGRWRATDNELPVDANGSFSLNENESFSFESGVDLALQLSTSNQVRDCYALRWARYATGMYLEDDEPDVQTIQSLFRQDDSIPSLLESITTSDLFRHLSKGGAQ